MRHRLPWTFILLALAAPARAEVNAGVELLAKAARAGNLKAAEDLLEVGVNPDLPDANGSTALVYAASMNQVEAVHLLLSYHADPNAGTQTNMYRSTPLQYAASFGNLRMGSMLIAAGAEVNKKGPAGKTALLLAGPRGLDMIQLLIEKGADVNLRDAEGDSALDEAVWAGALDATAILLARGAHLNEPQTKSGATPINEAAYRGHAAIVRYLLQFHPDLNAPDKRGYSPLDNALRMGKEECGLALIAALPREQKTAAFLEKTLNTAIARKQSSVAEALLQEGAKADGTQLEDAALKGLDNIVEVLLNHGAKVNQVNPGSGTTALYAAAAFGHGATVRLLLERGADPNLCGTNKRSPYQAASENGYTDAADQIKKSGGGNRCR